MSEETRAMLKEKYNLSDEALDDILVSGAEGGPAEPAPARQEPMPVVQSPSMPSMMPGAESESGVDLMQALKGGDLDDLMKFMVIDNWVKERFGKGKVPPEVQAILDDMKSGKKKEGSSLDSLIETMMKYEVIQSFMDSRKARGQPQQQPQQQQPTVDVERAIREIGDKMTEALRTHKLEDEKERAEERAKQKEAETAAIKQELIDRDKAEADEKRLKARVEETVEPLQRELNDRMKIINERLQNVPKEERKQYMLDLNEVITETVGDELKGRIVTSIQDAFTKEEAPPVTQNADGKLQVDFYRLGERALKTIDNFINKLPQQAPPRREVQKLPPLKTPPVAAQPAAPAEREKTIITEKAPKEVQQTAPKEIASSAPTTTKPPEPPKSSQKPAATTRSKKA